MKPPRAGVEMQMRMLVVATLLVACENPSVRPAVPRAKLDTHALPVALPARGHAVQTFGIGGHFDLAIADSDARTLRVIIHGDRDVDRTLPLDAAQVQRLDALADRTWREVPRGKMPEAHDIMQDLFIVDRDDGFFLRGHPIMDIGGHAHTGRPLASQLVLETLALARPVFEPPPAVAPPHALTTRHRHAVARASLVTPHTDPAVLPKRGVVLHAWYLHGETTIVIDRDARTMRVVQQRMGEPTRDRKRAIDASKLDEIVTLAFDAWHENATGPTPVATDIREDLIVLDDDEAFYVSGHPISTSSDGDKTGRPAAARVLRAIYQAAE